MPRSSIRFAAIVVAVALSSPPDLEGAHDSLNLSTGYDEVKGQQADDGAVDLDYAIVSPKGDRLKAKVLPNDQYPISPAGPWVENGNHGKWIGLDASASTGAPGDYLFVRQVVIPADVRADQLEIVGWWTSDDAALDVVINGVSTGTGTTGDFTRMHPFPGNAGLGRFHTGLNEIAFRVNNVPGIGRNPDNPVGLYVEAGLALSPSFSGSCWEGLPLEFERVVGGTFSADGASYVVHPLVLQDGSKYELGSARVVTAGAACQLGQELRLGNVNVEIDFGAPLSALDVHFGHHGGNINLSVNGAFFNGSRFRHVPASLGGVSVSTLEFGPPGQSCGVLRLRGSIETLRIGGVELGIDCLDATRMPVFRRGDANGDGEVDIADAAHIFEALFVGAPALACPRAADSDGDFSNQISDGIRILHVLFTGAATIPAPGPFTCGPSMDPPGAGLPCDYDHCPVRTDSTIPAIELHLSAPAVVSGPAGTQVTFEAAVDLCWQSQSGAMLRIDAIRGWGLGVSRVGGQAITIQGATDAGTDAERAFGTPFHRSDVLGNGSAVVNATVLDLRPGRQPIVAPLQPTGTGASCQTPSRILRIQLAARIPATPGACAQETLRFEEGLQGPGQPVPIRVAFTGRMSGVPFGAMSSRPALGPAASVRICANNTAPGSSVTVDAGAGVSVTFPQVGSPGYTSAMPTGSGQPPPRGFQVLDSTGGAPAYYSVTTTAGYTGVVEICFPYIPPPGLTPAQEEQAIRLMVYEPAQGAWSDVTTRVDTVARIVCGASHLSDFGLFASREPPPVPGTFRRGDANGDSEVDISDAVNILNFLFVGAAAPGCPDTADANDDGSIDISDPIRVLNFLFLDGDNPIPAPGPNECGLDRTEDKLADCADPEGPCPR